MIRLCCAHPAADVVAQESVLGGRERRYAWVHAFICMGLDSIEV